MINDLLQFLIDKHFLQVDEPIQYVDLYKYEPRDCKEPTQLNPHIATL